MNDGAMTLGIDSGPTSSGWALVDFSIPSAPVWFEHGSTERIGALFDMLESRGLAAYVKLVAVEEPRGRVDPVRVYHVLRTTWEGGRAEGFAEARGFTVARLGAHEWRHALVGAYRAGDNVDHLVKVALGRFVRHFPQRSNTHHRDAGGIACVATRDWRRAIRLATHAPSEEVGAR